MKNVLLLLSKGDFADFIDTCPQLRTLFSDYIILYFLLPSSFKFTSLQRTENHTSVWITNSPRDIPHLFTVASQLFCSLCYREQSVRYYRGKHARVSCIWKWKRQRWQHMPLKPLKNFKELPVVGPCFCHFTQPDTSVRYKTILQVTAFDELCMGILNKMSRRAFGPGGNSSCFQVSEVSREMF